MHGQANLILVACFPSFLAVQGLGMKSCISQFDGQNFFPAINLDRCSLYSRYVSSLRQVPAPFNASCTRGWKGQGPVNKHGDGYTSACTFSSALTFGQSSILLSPSNSYSDRSLGIRLISVIVFQLLAVAIRLLNCRNPSSPSNAWSLSAHCQVSSHNGFLALYSTNIAC